MTDLIGMKSHKNEKVVSPSLFHQQWTVINPLLWWSVKQYKNNRSNNRTHKNKWRLSGWYSGTVRASTLSVCMNETILLCMSHYVSGNANQYSWLITSWIQSCFPSHVSPCALGGQKHLQHIRHGRKELVLCLTGLFQIYVALYLTIDLRGRNIGRLLYPGQGLSGSRAYLRNAWCETGMEHIHTHLHTYSLLRVWI